MQTSYLLALGESYKNVAFGGKTCDFLRDFL